MRRGTARIVGILTGVVLYSLAGAGGWPTAAHAATASPGDIFGYSAAVDGDTAVYGSPQDDPLLLSNAGSATVFVRSGTTWTKQATLTANNASPGDFFGRWVEVDANTVIVGAPRNTSAARTETAAALAGSAYVFVRSGSSWSQQAELSSSDSSNGDLFGRGVAIEGDTAVVSAPFHDTNGKQDAGAAYVFVRSGSTWTKQAKLSAPDGRAGDLFSKDIALSGDTLIIGSPSADPGGLRNSGAAYIFVRSGSTWTLQAKLVSPGPQYAGKFGRSVGVSGETVVVAAPYEDTSGGADAGRDYVFTRSGSTWTMQAPLIAPDGAANDRLGFRMDFQGDTAVLNAPQDDCPGVNNCGSVYVYVRSGTTWALQQKILPPTPGVGDHFGRAAGIDGDTAAFGSPYDDTSQGKDAGSGYVFVRSGGAWSLQASFV
ncbi:MAG: hypothetical protein ABR518_04060 [Actinomycetota bacterium]